MDILYSKLGMGYRNIDPILRVDTIIFHISKHGKVCLVGNLTWDLDFQYRKTVGRFHLIFAKNPVGVGDLRLNFNVVRPNNTMLLVTVAQIIQKNEQTFVSYLLCESQNFNGLNGCANYNPWI